MPLSTIQLNDSPLTVKDAYYTGSVILKQGQPLCHVAGSAFTTAPNTKDDKRGFDVAIPNGNNAMFFAGIVHESSVGQDKPGLIKIIVPQKGDVLDVLVANVAAVAVGSIVRLDEELFTTATTTGDNSSGALRLLEAATITATETNILTKAAKILGVAMQTLAVSTGAGNFARHLIRVQFI